MNARHQRTTLTFQCGACDKETSVPADTAVIVYSAGGLMLTLTCGRCGVVNGTPSLDKCADAMSAGTQRVVLRVSSLSAGAHCDGPLDDAEVAVFVARLDATPDGRSPGAATDWGRRVVLSGLWTDLAGVES